MVFFYHNPHTVFHCCIRFISIIYPFIFPFRQEYGNVSCLLRSACLSASSQAHLTSRTCLHSDNLQAAACYTEYRTLPFHAPLPDKTDKIIAIKPIKELGSYKERLATAWCITYKAYENGKAEGIFKYFIDTMLDGGDIQIAWQYGAKGTHWDDKAETVTVYNSKGEVDEKKTKTYEEGVFHFLPTPEDNTKLMSKNHIDKSLAIATFGDNTDPGNKSVDPLITENYAMFNANSKLETPLWNTEVLSNNISDINTKRLEVVSQVVLGEKTYDEAMADYKKQVGAKCDAVVESLNETLKK